MIDLKITKMRTDVAMLIRRLNFTISMYIHFFSFEFVLYYVPLTSW